MKKKNILFFLLCFLLTSLSAQTLEQARGMYGRGQYAEAKPVFKNMSNRNQQTVITTYGTVCVASKQVMLPRP